MTAGDAIEVCDLVRIRIVGRVEQELADARPPFEAVQAVAIEGDMEPIGVGLDRGSFPVSRPDRSCGQ
jgi:hypothetical protein